MIGMVTIWVQKSKALTFSQEWSNHGNRMVQENCFPFGKDNCRRRYRSFEVFEDWLSICHATLQQLPTHIKKRNQNLPLVDTPETTKLMKRIWSSHSAKSMDYFSQAFAVLMESAAVGGNDTLGDVYQEYANPKPGAGQFFSPMPLAQVMAWAMCQDIEKEVKQRIMDAVDRSPMAKAAAMAGLMLKRGRPPDVLLGSSCAPISARIPTLCHF